MRLALRQGYETQSFFPLLAKKGATKLTEIWAWARSNSVMHQTERCELNLSGLRARARLKPANDPSAPDRYLFWIADYIPGRQNVYMFSGVWSLFSGKKILPRNFLIFLTFVQSISSDLSGLGKKNTLMFDRKLSPTEIKTKKEYRFINQLEYL